MKFNLPRDVEYLLSRLESAGYRADIVGGSVRDVLLGKEPGDYDVTTSALPDEVKAVFADERTIDTGIKHGTVTLLLGGKPYEITTYRFDGKYSDMRHPESVTFTRNISDDLMRRDFTVNAMAYSPTHSLTDLYGGREDVEAKIIRAVGDPAIRFSEDALRILRAVRFAATLGFEIEEQTAAEIFNKMHLLSNVSAERIYVELKKTLCGDFAHSVLTKFSSLFLYLIPEILELRLPTCEIFAELSWITRILSLFALSADEPSDAFASFAARLRMDNATRNIGISVLAGLGKFDFSTDKGMTYALMNIGESYTRELMLLEVALGRANAACVESLENLLAYGVVFRVSDLAVDGNDLKSVGASGKEIGELLSFLLTEVIEQRIKNEPTELLRVAKEHLSQN